MDIVIGAKNFKLTPAINEYVNEKVGKLAHFWGEIIRAHVELSTARLKTEGDVSHVHVRLEVPGPDLEAEADSSEMYSAIDIVLPKLEKQIAKARGKAQGRRRSIKSKL